MATGMPISCSTYCGGRTIKTPSPDAVDLPTTSHLFAAVELARVSRPLSAAVSFVVSFTPVRGRSPVFARIVFVQFADGPEPR